MEQLLTGTAVSNFGLESGSTPKINHCVENIPSYLSAEEKAFRKEHLKDNLFIPGKCSSPDMIKKHIKDSRKLVQSKRNRFELKESVVSLPLPESMESMSIKQKQDILRKLASKYQNFFEKGFYVGKRFIQADCLGTFIHLNEKGKIHIHQLWDNKWKDEKGIWRWGWKGGSINKPQINSIQKIIEKEIFIPFCKELKIPVLTQQQNHKVVRVQYKKKIKIEEYKKLKSFEDQLKGVSSMSPELKQLQEQFEERTGEKLNLDSLNRYIDDSIQLDKIKDNKNQVQNKSINTLEELYSVLDSLPLTSKDQKVKGAKLSDIVKSYVAWKKNEGKIRTESERYPKPAPAPHQLTPKVVSKGQSIDNSKNKGFSR